MTVMTGSEQVWRGEEVDAGELAQGDSSAVQEECKWGEDRAALEVILMAGPCLPSPVSRRFG